MSRKSKRSLTSRTSAPVGAKKIASDPQAKQAAPGESAQDAHVDHPANQPKRGRGRPRKIPAPPPAPGSAPVPAALSAPAPPAPGDNSRFPSGAARSFKQGNSTHVLSFMGIPSALPRLLIAVALDGSASFYSDDQMQPIAVASPDDLRQVLSYLIGKQLGTSDAERVQAQELAQKHLAVETKPEAVDLKKVWG